MTESLQERAAALERAETFSETKQAMMALVKGGELEALEVLLPALLRTENENLLYYIGRKALAGWGEALLSRIHLDDENASELEKRNALHIFLWDGGDLGQAMLCEAAEDSSLEIRLLAVRLLGEIEKPIPEVFQVLETRALEDESLKVRKEAAKALAEGSDPRAIAILEKVLTRNNEDSIENLLIDLRLRVIEKLRPGLIPGRERRFSDEHWEPGGRIETMGRFEFALVRVKDSLRGIFLPMGNALSAGVFGGEGRGSFSPARLALCLIVSGVLAYSVFNYTKAVAQVRVRPEATAYSCPACGFIEERILTPSSRCSRCGKPVFADRGHEAPVLATTLDGREDK
jgi:hypothetical protein